LEDVGADKKTRSAEAAIFTLIALGVVLMLVTLNAARSVSKDDLEPLLTRLDGLDRVAAEHAGLTRELDAVKKRMGDPDKLTGSGAAGNQVTEAIYRNAKKSRIKIKRVQLIAARKRKSDAYILAGARATLNCRVENLVKFLEALDKDSDTAGVTEMSLSGDPKKPGQLAVTVSVVTLARK